MNLLASHNAVRCPIRLSTCRNRAPCANVVQRSQKPHCGATGLFSRKSHSACKPNLSICRVAAPEKSSSSEQFGDSENFDALAELDKLHYPEVEVSDGDYSDEEEDPEFDQLYKSLDALLAEYKAGEKSEDTAFNDMLSELRSELTADDDDESDADITSNAFDSMLAQLKSEEYSSDDEDLVDDIEDLSDEDEDEDAVVRDAEALGWFDDSSDDEDSDDEEFEIDDYAESFNVEEDTEDDALLNPFFDQLVDLADKEYAATTARNAILLEPDEDDEEEESQRRLKQIDQQYLVGDRLTGRVTQVADRFVSVDISGKTEAICPVAEISLAKVRRAGHVLKVGDLREFEVTRGDQDGDASVLLSMRKFEEEVCWRRVQQLADENVTVMGTVTGQNEGGLVVEVENLGGFVPMSHVTSQTDTENTEELLGTKIPVKFLEVDQERGRLVFSARKVASEKELQAYKIGDVAEGIVQSIKPYGAFIELGPGLSGLLHISQISFDRVTNVGGVLTEGDKLKVMILSQDKDRGRMSLSTKKLEPTPGDMLKDPQLVYDKADEMAESFRKRLAEAEATARAEGINFPDMQGYDTGSFDSGGYDQGGGYGSGGYGSFDQQSYDSQSYDSQDFPADQRY